MDWNAIGASGEVLGGLAVLVTLIYLARQIRQLTRQHHFDAFKQYEDQINAYLMHVSGSKALTDIVTRGRRDLASLDEAERQRFEYVHFQLLNFVESHHMLASATAIDEAYRAWAMNNLEDIIRAELTGAGARQWWQESEGFFNAEVGALVNGALKKADAARKAKDAD